MELLERLISDVREACSGFPDKRKGGGLGAGAPLYSMADIGMSAFSLFFMQSDSFLAHQRDLEDIRSHSNCRTLFGMEKIPTDNHIRAMLDPVAPSHLQGAFDATFSALRDGGGLKDFTRLDGRILIALDGTEYFCSQKIGCPHCLTRKRANGKLESYHAMLAATLVAPGHDKSAPLMPEFIANGDGAEKQDCERNAAKRWLEAHGGRMAAYKPVYLGDDLFACQPICASVRAAQGDFLMTAKPASHKTLYDFMAGAETEERVVRRKEGRQTRRDHYRWFTGAPLREGKEALEVNWLSLTITDGRGKVTYRGSWVTSLPVSRETVAEIAACARARWKIENESFNVLKNNGYHLEHNFGHGKENLAMLFAAFNLLAFAIHTVCDIAAPGWQEARTAKRSRKRFFEHIRTITAYLIFPDWETLMTTLIRGKPPPEIEKQFYA